MCSDRVQNLVQPRYLCAYSVNFAATLTLPTLCTYTSHTLQVIPNACATQAILSVLLNAEDKLQLGSTLSDFLSFTRDFPPDLKGLAISNSDQIRTVHNGFSRQDPFVHEKSDEQDDDKDAYHFIAYLPHKGKVSLL
jgi:Ubiquitin carboxyl-terminal hydrolase, family 1